MSQLPQTPPFVAQEFQVLFMKIGNQQQSFIQSIDITRTDGGADIKTLALGWAGRVQGAAMASISCSGVVPYSPDNGGGFSTPGMNLANGNQLDQTMLTGWNTNSNLPVQFIVSIGQPAAQKCSFTGYISEIKTSVSVGNQISYSFVASGSFSVFSS